MKRYGSQSHMGKGKKKKPVPVYTMKAQKRSTDIAPHIPNLGYRWR
jgi:hypothetical protein